MKRWRAMHSSIIVDDTRFPMKLNGKIGLTSGFPVKRSEGRFTAPRAIQQTNSPVANHCNGAVFAATSESQPIQRFEKQFDSKPYFLNASKGFISWGSCRFFLRPSLRRIRGLSCTGAGASSNRDQPPFGFLRPVQRPVPGS